MLGVGAAAEARAAKTARADAPLALVHVGGHEGAVVERSIAGLLRNHLEVVPKHRAAVALRETGLAAVPSRPASALDREHYYGKLRSATRSLGAEGIVLGRMSAARGGRAQVWLLVLDGKTGEPLLDEELTLEGEAAARRGRKGKRAIRWNTAQLVSVLEPALQRLRPEVVSRPDAAARESWMAVGGGETAGTPTQLVGAQDDARGNDGARAPLAGSNERASFAHSLVETELDDGDGSAGLGVASLRARNERMRREAPTRATATLAVRVELGTGSRRLVDSSSANESRHASLGTPLVGGEVSYFPWADERGLSRDLGLVLRGAHSVVPDVSLTGVPIAGETPASDARPELWREGELGLRLRTLWTGWLQTSVSVAGRYDAYDLGHETPRSTFTALGHDAAGARVSAGVTAGSGVAMRLEAGATRWLWAGSATVGTLRRADDVLALDATAALGVSLGGPVQLEAWARGQRVTTARAAMSDLQIATGLALTVVAAE